MSFVPSEWTQALVGARECGDYQHAIRLRRNDPGLGADGRRAGVEEERAYWRGDPWLCRFVPLSESGDSPDPPERGCPLCHEILGLDAPEAKPYLDYGFVRVPVESAARPDMVGEGKLNGLATEPPVDTASPEPLYRIVYATDLGHYGWPLPWGLMLHYLRAMSPGAVRSVVRRVERV